MNLLSKITEEYFKPRFFEGKRGLYEKIGVNIYKKYLWRPFMKSIHLYTEIRIENRKIEHLEEFINYTKGSEVAHLSFIGVLIFIEGYSALIDPAVIFGGYYPIALQRYNRSRVSQILKKEIKKSNKN